MSMIENCPLIGISCFEEIQEHIGAYVQFSHNKHDWINGRYCGASQWTMMHFGEWGVQYPYCRYLGYDTEEWIKMFAGKKIYNKICRHSTSQKYIIPKRLHETVLGCCYAFCSDIPWSEECVVVFAGHDWRLV